jgi:hypothetical protein
MFNLANTEAVGANKSPFAAISRIGLGKRREDHAESWPVARWLPPRDMSTCLLTVVAPYRPTTGDDAVRKQWYMTLETVELVTCIFGSSPRRVKSIKT